MSGLDKYIAACISLNRLREITPTDQEAENKLLDEMDDLWDALSPEERNAANLWVKERA